jgi:uncharacterized protein
MAQSKPGQIATAAGRCPICKAPAEAQNRPFCSARCADVDLSRWLRGAYVISGELDDDEDGDAPASAGQEPMRE